MQDNQVVFPQSGHRLIAKAQLDIIVLLGRQALAQGGHIRMRCIRQDEDLLTGIQHIYIDVPHIVGPVLLIGQLVSDEPVEQGGADSGANPYELLLAALGSCTSMTLRMYANHKKLDLEAIEVTLRHSRVHLDDCKTCDDKNTLVDKIDRKIKLVGRLDDDQRKRLLEIADKCPVHKTLVNEIVIETKLTQ